MSILDLGRIYVISGAFGTGKTEVSINLAKLLKSVHNGGVLLVDLDIVNPYFRSRHHKETLAKEGIEVISSLPGYEDADVPAVNPAIMSAFDRKDVRVVFDVGGSDLGATVLAMYREKFEEEDTHHLLVVNPYRPFNGTTDDTVDMARKIEAKSGLKYEAAVANPHLMGETTEAVVRDGFDRVREMVDIPVRYLSIRKDLVDPARLTDLDGVELVACEKQIKQPWER